MISLKERGRYFVPRRGWSYVACITVIFVSLFTLPGCGGPSKEEQAKQDEQGKQMNDAAMKRMIQERTGGAPGSGGN